MKWNLKLNEFSCWAISFLSLVFFMIIYITMFFFMVVCEIVKLSHNAFTILMFLQQTKLFSLFVMYVKFTYRFPTTSYLMCQLRTRMNNGRGTHTFLLWVFKILKMLHFGIKPVAHKHTIRITNSLGIMCIQNA